MNCPTTRDRLVKIVANQVTKDAEVIKDDDHLIEDLGADDFDLQVILEGIEDEFETRLSDDEWAGCGTIADTIEVIQRVRR
jgi:acyl carrier protein